jgi:hypothetical protein
MKSKIITLAATVLAAGALSIAPAGATPAGNGSTGTVHVVANVLPYANITETQDAIQPNWNGPMNVPFFVMVDTNDQYGYTYTFTGANPSTGGGPGSFALVGSANNNGYTPNYGITGQQNETYQNGVAGTMTYNRQPFPDLFNVVLPDSSGLPADSYTDTLTVTVTPNYPD